MGILKLRKLSRGGGLSGPGEANFNLGLLAICDRRDMTELQVLTDPKCPKIYQNLQNLGYETAIVKSVSATQRKREPFFWDIDCSISTSYDDVQDPDPLKRPADINADSTPIEIPCIVDADGNPILTTAGETIEDLTTEAIAVSIVIKKNIPPTLPAWLLKYTTGINAQPVSIDGIEFAKESLKVSRVSIGSKKSENNRWFREASITLDYMDGGWDLHVANKGFQEIIMAIRTNENGQTSVEEVRTPILDHTGKQVNSSQWLDKKGRAYRENMDNPRIISPLKQKLTKNEIIILRVKNRKRLDFNQLPLR